MDDNNGDSDDNSDEASVDGDSVVNQVSPRVFYKDVYQMDHTSAHDKYSASGVIPPNHGNSNGNFKNDDNFDATSKLSPRQLQAVRLKQIKVDDTLKDALLLETKQKLQKNQVRIQ